MLTVRVNRKAADRVASGHPWVFSSDITDSSDVTDRGDSRLGGPHAGDAVRVVDPRGGLVGVAHYSSTSQITLRLLSRPSSNRADPIDREFFRRRLAQAIAHRERVVENSDACRLVFSEADLLPGLIVDRYGPYLVMQLLTQGMDRARELITDCLTEMLHPAGILARNDASVRRLEGLPIETRILAGQIPERVGIEMNGLNLEADLLHGQKTGVYLDQRENYVAAARHARGRVLDCFTSTGGFALHAAARAGSRVESVDAIDSSASALASAEVNARANGIANIQFRQADVFDFLAGISLNEPRKYSMVILDPPAFAKSRKQLDAAARGYKEINLRALRLLGPGGILVTCSCSHHMSEAMLLQIVAEAALEAGRTLRILERRTQAADHPILLTVPETLYLKCLILEVLDS
jgi:23S rRNA (cytosine1962-C5)-methyltransferase